VCRALPCGAGVGLRHLTGEVKRVLKRLISLDQDNYPEMLGHTCIINAGAVVTFIFRLVKPYLDIRTQNKIEVGGCAQPSCSWLPDRDQMSYSACQVGPSVYPIGFRCEQRSPEDGPHVPKSTLLNPSTASTVPASSDAHVSSCLTGNTCLPCLPPPPFWKPETASPSGFGNLKP
jgi:CRAL/TRIO domain